MTQPSALAPILKVLAALVVILAGIHLAAPVLNPILFALVLSLLFGPLYTGLKRRGVPVPLAMLAVLVGLLLVFGLLFSLIGLSVAQLSANLGQYAGQLDDRLAQGQVWLQQYGLTMPQFQSVFSSGLLVSVGQTLLKGLADFVSSFFLIVMITLFLLAEGPALMARLKASFADSPGGVEKLTQFGHSVIRQFGLRGIVNGVTAIAVVITLALLGIDFPVLWGVLLFFLSYVPYIGIFIAAIPPVLLALAEFGLPMALVVIAGFTVANILAENILSPFLMGRGLSLSPTVVFLSFVVWVWLLGGPGAFLAMPLTFLLILLLDSFSDSRWLANLMLIR